MEIQFLGANCVRLTTKKASIIVDDNLEDLGQKSVTKKGDVALFTSAHGDAPADSKITIDSPGEYEVSDISIQGISARSHIDEEGKHSATIFRIVADDLRVIIAGHIYPDLNDAQLEGIGMADVLILPVGGNGYTLDGIGAQKIIKEIEPKLVIPTHYEQNGLAFAVPQQPLAEALKGLAMEPKETLPKLKVKAGELGDVTQLIVLEK